MSGPWPLPLPGCVISLLPGRHKVSNFLRHTHHPSCFCSTTGLKATQPTRCGLKPVRPRAKKSVSFIKLFISGICHHAKNQHNPFTARDTITSTDHHSLVLFNSFMSFLSFSITDSEFHIDKITL